MNRLSRVGLLLVLGSSASVVAGPSDVLVRISPINAILPLNDTVTVNIVADISLPVAGWGLDLVLSDPSLVTQVSPPAIGPLWNAAPTGDGDGLAGLAFPDAVSGEDLLLAQLEFRAEALGTTVLSLGVTPGDLSEGFALEPDGFATVTFESATITVVPEPALAPLLAVAAVALRRARRGRAARAA